MNPFKLTPSKISQSVESNLSTNIEFAIINIGTELGVDVYETEFINKVGKISEEEGHHPDIMFGWGYAKINITTHAIKGLSENDFILAAKIDQIFNV